MIKEKFSMKLICPPNIYKISFQVPEDFLHNSVTTQTWISIENLCDQLVL